MNPGEGPWLFGYATTRLKSTTEDRPVRVAPLGRVNFLVGRNNHGKSTVLLAARRWAEHAVSRQQDTTSETLFPAPRSQLARWIGPDVSLEQLIQQGKLVEIDDDRLGLWLPGIRGSLNGSQAASIVRQVLRTLGTPQLKGTTPPLPTNQVLIPAFRRIRSAGEQSQTREKPDLASGEGLIEQLGAWLSPANPGTDEYRQSRRRASKLREFMRDVLEDREADLEVAHTQRDLHVRLAQAGDMLDINQLGDGIKQVLMIAAACIYYDDHLVLLEEPEIHLHAGLQRKLMRFLANQTENQYIVATHSAHILDLPGARIFHVTHDGSGTTVSAAVRASEVSRVCQDLGYMASDLLQANYTIWVEGPSDRLYWRRWLELVDDDLVEGVHYTIMAYGGYLIDGVHLRDEPDPEVVADDLVQLLRLGRQCTVIADSDKADESAPLRESIQRLREEADSPGSGHLLVCEWVSTVENLLPRDLFRSVVKDKHSRAGKRLQVAAHTPFSPPFHGMAAGSYSKVQIARRVAEQLDESHLDAQLRPVVVDLAERIRSANGLRSLVAPAE